jgi:Cupin
MLVSMETPGSIRHDDLSDFLQAVRFRGVVFCRSELSAPWGFSVLGRQFASFHSSHAESAVSTSMASTIVSGCPRAIVILPAGHAHTVRDSPSSPATRLEELMPAVGIDEPGALRSGGGGAETVLVCGGFQWDDGATSPIVASLPPIIHLHGRSRGVDNWLRFTLAFLSEEAESGRPGAEIAVTRLADLLSSKRSARIFCSRDAESWASCGPSGSAHRGGHRRHPTPTRTPLESGQPRVTGRECRAPRLPPDSRH